MALLFVTNVACTPIVYVQPTGTMSFQQLLEADATIDARIAAHNIKGRVGVEPPELFANAGFEFVAELFQPREVFLERLDVRDVLDGRIGGPQRADFSGKINVCHGFLSLRYVS